MTITDEDIEYAVLFAIMGDTDFDTAAHALFDMKGIDDPVARDVIWRHEKGGARLSQMWARVWLVYGYGYDPNEFPHRIEK